MAHNAAGNTDYSYADTNRQTVSRIDEELR